MTSGTKRTLDEVEEEDRGEAEEGEEGDGEEAEGEEAQGEEADGEEEEESEEEGSDDEESDEEGQVDWEAEAATKLDQLHSLLESHFEGAGIDSEDEEKLADVEKRRDVDDAEKTRALKKLCQHALDLEPDPSFASPTAAAEAHLASQEESEEAEMDKANLRESQPSDDGYTPTILARIGSPAAAASPASAASPAAAAASSHAHPCSPASPASPPAAAASSSTRTQATRGPGAPAWKVQAGAEALEQVRKSERPSAALPRRRCRTAVATRSHVYVNYSINGKVTGT